jgi:hypothetical protein
VYFVNIILDDYQSCLFQVLSCPYSVRASKKNKIRTAAEAVKDIPDGARLLVGGKEC